MCLAVPGQVVEVVVSAVDAEGLGRRGVVDFRGNRIEVDLSLVPEVAPGGWVLVHAGFALEALGEEEALETWEWLREAGVVA